MQKQRNAGFLLTQQAEWLSPADNDGKAQFVQVDIEKVARGTVMWIRLTPLDADEQVLVHALSAKVCHKPGQWHCLAPAGVPSGVHPGAYSRGPNRRP